VDNVKIHFLSQRQPSRAEEAALGAGSEVACKAWFGFHMSFPHFEQ
jgi:hypothetical protein